MASPTSSSTEQAPLKEHNRRFSFSFRRFSFVKSNEENQAQAIITTEQENNKRAHAAFALAKRIPHIKSSKAKDKRAKQNAVMLRAVIIGPTSSSPQVAKSLAKPELSRLKSELIKPNSANRIIHELRALPDAADDGDVEKRITKGPIHAVCLAHTDEEEHQMRFAALSDAGSAATTELASLLSSMKVIDLVTSDFGLGQPGDGEGLLAGALPTPETIIQGIKQITPELMALGYATGQSFVPDHSGVYPPTDRMSVFTYWWGLELVLPPPSLAYLASAQSITGTVVNFLSALALINNGVKEILPFIRYISQFVDFEFNAIRKQDQGQGVVCAATWIMPAALVPRPWDFPELPPKDTSTADPTSIVSSPQTVPSVSLPESHETESATEAISQVPSTLVSEKPDSTNVSPATNIVVPISPEPGRMTT